MKVTSVVAAASIVASASAFVPAANDAHASTALFAKKGGEEKKSVASTIFGMDLFAPNKGVNDYGARKSKNLSLGKIGSNSYVPNGLSAEQYDKIRKNEQAKKDANYQRNVAKAGKFTDFTQWYKKRGTDISDAWIKGVNRGHDMAKTKYDWSGQKQEVPTWTGVSAKSKAAKGKGKK